ncbi:bifunctional hydroxymethylpyrimidine kinase/phosphomethylpyrimidine kinase [Desulfotomaculum varum]
MKHVLTVAGSDSCGGAGIQADLKTFSALGTYGMSALTAVTAQNTTGVLMVQEMPADLVAAQINCLFDDITVDAVKIGMVSSSAIIAAVAGCLAANGARHIVVDPVMVAKSGHQLLQPAACATLIEMLLPLADVVTPNIPEAEVLVKGNIKTLADMKQAAREIYRLGSKHVVIKGGHLTGEAVDVLYDGRQVELFAGPRLATRHTHGTGCTFAAAIAAYLARGFAVKEAVGAAKAYVTTAIAHALPLGRGHGPTHHFYDLYKQAGLLPE